MVIAAFLIVHYTISVLTKLSCFYIWKYGRGCNLATPKLWAWLFVEPPLLNFVEITTAKEPFFRPKETNVKVKQRMECG